MPQFPKKIFALCSLLLFCAVVVMAQGIGVEQDAGEKLSLIQHIEIWYAENMSYPVIILLMALESSFLGIIPSELIVSAAAYVALDSTTSLTFWGVVAVATVGSLLGGLINYTIAVFLGRRALYALADSTLGHFFLLNSDKLIKAEAWFVRYSKLSVCIGRLVPGVRQFISIPAGLSRMKLLPFMLYTIVGSGVWNVVLAALGYFLHGQQDLIKKYTFELSYIIVVALAAALIFFLIKYLKKKKAEKQHTRLFGLIGYPLVYSKSKKYFAEKFEREKVNARFELLEIKSDEELTDFCNKIKISTLVLRGFNVTFPLKEKIISFLDQIDAPAAEIGAVNCVKIIRNENGIFRLKGYNTDTLGFEQAIKPYLDKRTKRALVCGTGGVAKAIIAALARLEIPYTLVSRTKTDKTITYAEVSAQTIADHLLIINATNLGFGSHENECVTLPYEHITHEHLLYDVIYNPTETLFLQRGRQRGARTLNGSQMFAEQAEAAWALWNE
ncbi:MAG: VTT domain-containing protein [Prevotellaceae bacterium]|jgi:shikimate dehydrogenase|nr:VTT domain-containing protein [Prevotellaceae bacterium]